MNNIKIGLFGFGTVGQGVYQLLGNARNAHAEIKWICVRNVNKPRDIDVEPEKFTDDMDTILDDPEINLIVEVIDDASASYDIVTKSLCRGIPVVSGNKTMIAQHLPELIELQRQHNVALLYDASACGSIPVIRNLEEYYDNDLLLEVKGILNGSSNYILSRVFDHGQSYTEALQLAQRLGFAESDPTFDIGGFDALFKLIIITIHAMGVYVSPEKVFTFGIQNLHEADIRYAREKQVKIKLVAQVVKVSPIRFTMFVMPEFVGPEKYIYSVDNEYNGVVIRGEGYDRQFMFGKGAGRMPTASSILSDIMALHHDYRYEYKKMAYMERAEYTTDVVLRVYIRYITTNVPEELPFKHIRERYAGETHKYIVGDINLYDLISYRELLSAPDIFVVNIPQFFIDRDD